MILPKSVTDQFKGTFPQLLAAVSATMTCISDGMHYGWTAPIIPRLLAEDSSFPVTESQAEFLETILMLGACCGLPITMYLVDRIGRKQLLLGAAVLNLLAWAITAVAPNIYFIFCARFLAGLSGDSAFVAAPIYIAEMADQKIRGFLSSIIYLAMLIGIILVYCVTPFVAIWIPCMIGIFFCSITVVTFPFMPDSPYYLLYRDDPEGAKEALKRLRPTGNPDAELKEISMAIERQKTEKGRPRDLFLVKSNRKALLIMMWLNTSQHMSSISVMLMNLHSILDEAGSVHVSTTTAGIVFSTLMFCAAMSASLAIDNFGRRFLLMASGIFAGMSLTVIATFFTMKNEGFDVLDYSWIVPVAVLSYAAAFKFGLGLVPIVLTAELFPAKVKALGMTASDAFYVVFSIVSLQIYHQLKSRFGIHVPFYIFAFWCFLTVLFTFFYIPETKGKSLEEIQFILKGDDIDAEENNTSAASCKNVALVS